MLEKIELDVHPTRGFHIMDIGYTPDGAIDEVICTDASVHLEAMGEGAWCLIIDNAQGNWIFDITPQGVTLHEGPEEQWEPTAVLCNSLTSIPEGFDNNVPVTDILSAFQDCSSLIDVKTALRDCSSLEYISELNVEACGSVEDSAKAVPGWVLWLLVQWDRAKELWAKARH
jgi:hypothetical protein